MVDGVKHRSEFRARYELICEYVGGDCLRKIDAGDHAVLNQNLYGSVMTVLVSTLSLDIFRERSDLSPHFLAGYSVGQWSAIYAAEMIAYEQLIRIVVERARLMDKCVQREPGGMCGVIGISQSALEDVLGEMQAGGHRVFVANYNCLGQYSISGTLSGIRAAEDRIGRLKPKKLIRLPVSGAWHCPLLNDAENEFLEFLRSVPFRPRQVPVVDNVTNDLLPEDATQLRVTLARHLSHSVRWEQSIKMLIASGCTQFTEVGYGDMLTKFGFFIDRHVKFDGLYN